MRTKNDDIIKCIADRLVRWFDVNGRRFPWRFISDPYKILITELLLQRTKAETIEKIYDKFFNRFPNIGALAKADIAELKKIFSKLGLSYRAQRAKKVAEELMRIYGGKIPCNMYDLLKLKGIGVYIASATLNFGFNKPTPVVDKNVMRVLNRLRGITNEKSARIFVKKLFNYGDNQKIAYALIDLGSLICVENPKCTLCPLKGICHKIPLKKEKWRFMRKIIGKDGMIRLREQPTSK